MSTFRVLGNDLHRSSDSMTASSAVPGLPPLNTRDSRRSLPWRSVGAAPQTFTAQIDPMAGLCVVVLSNTNLTLSATVSAAIRNGSTTVATVPMSCLGRNPDGTTTWVAWVTVASANGYQISISDGSNPYGFFQIVQILAGQVLDPEFGPSYGAETEWVEDVEHIETATQSLRSEGTGTVRRRMTIDLSALDPSSRSAFVNAMAVNQKYTTFVSLYTGDGGDLERDHRFACKRITNLGQSHWTYKLWRQEMVFLET